MTDTDAKGSRWEIMFVAAAAIAVYLNSLANGFAYDDVHIIQQNPRVHDLGNLRDIWLTPYWPTFGAELGLYRPLTIFSYAVQWAVGGGSPWIFHATNVALHAIVSVLVFLLLTRFVGRGAALFGAVVFAVHPVHTEAVANVVGQAEILAAAGVIGACLLHASRADGPDVRLPRLLVISTLFALALAAKEHAIVLPGLLLAIDVAQGRVGRSSGEIARYVRAVLPGGLLLVAVATLFLAVRAEVLGSVLGGDAGPSLPYLREDRRILSAFRAWPEFARLLFFPSDLAADYSPAVILPVEELSPLTILGACLLAGTICLTVLTPLRPVAGFPAAWFLVTILPVSNLLFPIGVLVAERTLYLPSFAVAAAAAFAWAAIARAAVPGARRGAFAVASVAVSLLAGRTMIRNPDWRDTRAVMDALLRDHPESYRAQWSAAAFALEAGDTATSNTHWELAYRLWPRDPQLLTEFGAYNLRIGRYDRAVELLEAAYASHPDVLRTVHLLGMAYLHARQYESALEMADHALGLGGPLPVFFELRARALMGLGRDRDAITSWRAAIHVSGGGNSDLWRMLAWAHVRAGDKVEAREALDVALARAGDDEAARSMVAQVAALLEEGIED